MPLISLSELAQKLGGELVGDGTLKVGRLVHPADARDENDLAVAFDKQLHPLLQTTKAQAVILAKGQEESGKAFKAALYFGRPRAALAGLTALFAPPSEALEVCKDHIHPTAYVDATATLGRNVTIGPFCYIGPRATIGDNCILVSQVTVSAEAQLGSGCTLLAGVRIGPGVKIGNRVIIHFNAVIGADGFSFVTPEASSGETAKTTGSSTVEAFNTNIQRIYSLGSVTIGDDVEIGANTAIDRGTLTDTRIGKNTKIDNLVQIAHNVEIGENCLICGTAAIAGSTVIGNRVTLAARAGVADHIRIGDDAILMASSQLGSNLPSKQIYLGAPAMPRERFMEQIMHSARLKQTVQRIADLEAKITHLANTLEKK